MSQLFYKDLANKVYALDNASERHFLPIECVEITIAQRDAIFNTPAKIKADQNATILSQIATLEASVTARIWRETLTKPTVKFNNKTPAELIAEVDAQITTLRGQLVA